MNATTHTEARGVPSPSPRDALARLTNSERLVLTFIAQGLSQKAMAAKLHRSIDTVKTHRRTLGKKLGSQNRVELTRLAIEHGVVPLESAPAPADDHSIHSGVKSSSMVPVALVGVDGVCSSVSPGFARVIGEEAGALSGARIADMLRLDMDIEIGELLEQVAAGAIVRTSGVLRRRDRSLVSLTAQFLPLPSPARRMYLVLSEVTPLPRCVEIEEEPALAAAS